MSSRDDELNQNAVDRAMGMLRHAAAPIASERRREVAEAIVTTLQVLQERHGMRHMLRLSQGYDAREPVRRQMWDVLTVTGPQVDGGIQAAALTLWEQA